MARVGSAGVSGSTARTGPTERCLRKHSSNWAHGDSTDRSDWHGRCRQSSVSPVAAPQVLEGRAAGDCTACRILAGTDIPVRGGGRHGRDGRHRHRRMRAHLQSRIRPRQQSAARPATTVSVYPSPLGRRHLVDARRTRAWRRGVHHRLRLALARGRHRLAAIGLHRGCTRSVLTRRNGARPPRPSPAPALT